MPWVRFDDHFDDSDDIDNMSCEAIALHLCATTWSSRNLTDGVIPIARAKKLPGGTNEAIEELCAGDKPWWIKVEGGYQIRSFLKYNPSGQEFKEKREEISRVRSEIGKKGGLTTQANKRTKANDQASKQANDQAKGDICLSKIQAPNPESRIPEEIRNTSKIISPNTHGVLASADARFEAFAREYPKRNGDLCKAEAKRKHLKRFADPDFAQTCIDAAIRYRKHCDHCNKTRTEKVAQMTTWLNQSRWTEPYEIMNGHTNMADDRDQILEAIRGKG